MDHIIIAFDEVSFNLGTTYKIIWFPRGEKPRGAFFWSSKKLITLGALTSIHEFYYDFYTSQNSITFRDFLMNIAEKLDVNKKYVFIMDNASWHKTEIIKDYLSKYNKWISVEYIPPYSPELNPIETCWKVTRNAVTKSQYFPTLNEMQEKLEHFWTKHTFMQNFITYLCP